MLPALFLVVVHLTSANIVFNRVEPSCHPMLNTPSGCLRGQVCLQNGTCGKSIKMPLTSLDVLQEIARIMTRQIHYVLGRQLLDDEGECDGYDVASCSTVERNVACCSRLGFVQCESPKVIATDDRRYCNEEECTLDSLAISTSLPLEAAVPANPTGFSAISSTTNEEPTLGQPRGAASNSSSASQNIAFTKDGSCGASFGGVMCGNWSRGSCCSMYGYCGNSSAHCGAGCQSGPCILVGPDQQPRARPAPKNAIPGSYKVVGDSGVPAMHAALLPNGKVLFLDKVENYTKLIFANGKHAYASEWDPATRQVAPLRVGTNPFCSGGSFLRDGTLLSIGGNSPLNHIDPTVSDGFRGIRSLHRAVNNGEVNDDSFIELGNLSTSRWYPSAQTLGNGQIFVASGSLNGLDPTKPENNNPTYEFLSATGATITDSEPLDVLVRNQPYYMYPFVHLLPTGDLFIFASKSSELWSPVTKRAVATFSDLPGDYRTYPNTGTSVLLPLSSSTRWEPEVMICGGGAYQDVDSPTDPSCGRIAPLAKTPNWEMDAMPEGRSMVDGVLLPDGTIVFLNGCSRGAQGFGLGQNPAHNALLYNPKAKLGKRWTKLAASPIPRLYHSVALLLLDGTVLIAGSNPVEQPVLTRSRANPYVTEFRIEVYTPPYLSGSNARKRPTNVTINTNLLKADRSTFEILTTVPTGATRLTVALHHGGFITHSLHMGQRMIFLDVDGFQAGRVDQNLKVTMPPNRNITPPGPYVIFVLADGIPSIGQFVLVS